MDRRDFLKAALSAAALAPMMTLSAPAKEGPDGDKAPEGKGPQVTRRFYKNTKLSVPLLGFGMMRLPRLAPDKPEIDTASAARMVARAMEAGVNYFDTAYFYHNGLSEKCAGEVLSKYPRDSFYLADKMPVRSLKKEEDIERIWNEQLAKCQVDYFDFYLVHNINRDRWETTKNLHVYEFLQKQQAAGKIRKLGFSFHDEPEVLQEVAAAHPWDFAQIQLNYLDWTIYHSREQYEILTKLGIPVVVMEPLRGGALANLNPDATAALRAANPAASTASWAMRYAASLPNVMCVLSGMTLDEHLEDNIKTFTDFKPLSDAEREAIEKALAAYRKSAVAPCTECRYCAPCPVGVDIPRVFGLYNQYKTSGNKGHFRMIYDRMAPSSKASACVACGVCLKKCPQKIQIPETLRKIEAEVGAPAGKKAAMFREAACEYLA